MMSRSVDMKIVMVLLSAVASISTATQAQSFFSIIPDFGGDEMDGIAYNVIPLEKDIKVIGLVHDSLVPGFDGGNWPIIGSVSYDGDYLGTQYLVDSTYSDGFVYFTRRIAFKNDSICYLYDRRDIGNEFLDAYLVELNYQKGIIVRSKIVYDELTDNEDFFALAITTGKDGKLYLVNITTEYGVFPPILTVLDSAFNVVSQSLIPNYGRKNYAKYIEVDEGGNLTMVGMSLGEATPVWWKSNLYKQVLDSNLNSIEFTLASTAFDQSIILSDAYPVIKNRNGDWVIASQEVRETPDCQGCTIGIPYIVCISNDFEEIFWETRMFDGDESSSKPLRWVNCVTEVADGYIMAGSRYGIRGIQTSGILGKVTLSGDSSWLKHYIPVGWDTMQATWFDWKDVKTTPQGNVLVAGRGFDSFNSIAAPWILHLDPDGCLDPGCNPASSFDGLESSDVDIRIFPNPAKAQCSIQVRTHTPSPDYTMKIFDNQGHLVRNLGVAGRDVQFILDLHGWPSGTYFVQLTDNKGRQLTRKFVVLE
jgi:hypothetical protein